MDDDVELGPGRDIPTDGIPVNFVPAKTGEVIKLGVITCRVLEDGSRTGEFSHACKPAFRAGFSGR